MKKKAKRNSSKRLLLADRSLNDIAAIEKCSIQEWGKKTATKYVTQIENALILIQENPDLLFREVDVHRCLQFYCINKHVLMFDVQPDELILLTVFHGAMDISSRLAKLQPTLAKEVKLLNKKLNNQ